MNADGAVVETGYTPFGQVAYTRAYSAYLKTRFADLSTEELERRMSLLQDARFDELTRYEYNTLGQIIARHSGSRGLTTSRYNAFGELEFSSQSINAQTTTQSAFDYDRRGLLIQRIEDVGGLAKYPGHPIRCLWLGGQPKRWAAESNALCA